MTIASDIFFVDLKFANIFDFGDFFQSRIGVDEVLSLKSENTALTRHLAPEQ